MVKCLSQDNLKSYLFGKAREFASESYENVDWDKTEHGNFGKYYFEEFLEYIEDDRPEQINLLIEKELECEMSLSECEDLDAYVDSIITQDEYHINNIVIFRDLIF